MITSSNKFSYLAALGFSIFPVLKGHKKPAVKWADYQKARAPDDDISLWDAGDYNVGVACGRLSNLLVIDVDSEEAQALYDTFLAPETPTVRTAKGRHYYFRYPASEVRNRVRVGEVALDVRGEGGYVVGPGSLHESGATYDWEISPETVPFAELPTALLKSLSAPLTSAKASLGTSLALRSPDADNRYSKWISDALANGLSRVEQAVEGERNDTLNLVAFRIASLVTAAGLAWEPYAEQLMIAATSAGLTESESENTIQSAWEGGQRAPCAWIETSQRYVYVACRDQFYDLQVRQGLNANAFNRMHNSERQWEKVAMATFLTNHNLIDKAFDLRFDPAQPTGVYVHDDQRWLNTYVDPGIVAAEGDLAPFVEFIEHLIPNDTERAHLLKMIAWTVRYPGKKLGHALLLRTERQGVGKSMLIEIWRELLGMRNTRLTTTEEIGGNFQSFLEGNLLVLVEELNFAFGAQAYNRIKNLITGSSAEVNEKFVSSRERPNHATFVFLTNLATPILIEDSDRRFFFIDSPAVPREPEFYAQFAEWWKSSLGIVRAYIDSIDLADFNPFAPPPETEAKRALQMASRSPLEQEIAEAMAERSFPFSRDIVRLEEVRASLPAARAVPLQRLNTAMRSFGAVPLGAHRASGEWFVSSGHQTYVGGRPSKPSLWAIANQEYWKLADPQDRVAEFARSRGMWVDYDDTDIEIRHARSHGAIYGELSSRSSV